VVAGELSANAAAIEAGFRRKAQFEQIMRLLPRLTVTEKRELVRGLLAELEGPAGVSAGAAAGGAGRTIVPPSAVEPFDRRMRLWGRMVAPKGETSWIAIA
jgi:hypothetical protein